MVATAHARPSRIQALLGQPQSGDVFSKRQHDQIYRFWSTTSYQVKFHCWTAVTVTPVVYFDGQTVAYASTPSGPGWPSLIEKAYAIWKGRDSYNRLNMGTTYRPVPDAQTVLGDLVGPSDMADISGGRFFPHNGNDRALTNADLTAMVRRATRRPTIAASLAQGAQNGVVSDHAYAVLRLRQSRVMLRNPWGGNGAEISLTIAQLLANFQAIWQAQGHVSGSRLGV